MSSCVIGIDLGGTKALFRSARHEARFSTGPLFSPQNLLQLLRTFLARNDLVPTHIGIAVPGLVDAEGQVAICDVLPSFSGWRARQDLAELCRSVLVLNDVEAALLEEMQDAPHASTAAVVMVGTAIGTAIVVDGKPLRGESGWAGELGYLPLAVNNQVRRLDELAGGAGIAAACGVSPAQLAQRAAAADPLVLDAIAAAGRCLGLGLAALINLFNPARIAAGGGTIELPGYWEAAHDTAAQHAIPLLWSDCSVEKTRSGAYTVVNGVMRAALT